jgi:hypothetical protein
VRFRWRRRAFEAQAQQSWASEKVWPRVRIWGGLRREVPEQGRAWGPCQLLLRLSACTCSRHDEIKKAGCSLGTIRDESGEDESGEDESGEDESGKMRVGKLLLDESTFTLERGNFKVLHYFNA